MITLFWRKRNGRYNIAKLEYNKADGHNVFEYLFITDNATSDDTDFNTLLAKF